MALPQTEVIFRAMTGKQARRYAMHINGETQVSIAAKEGVSQPEISQCLQRARKRVKNRIITL